MQWWNVYVQVPERLSDTVSAYLQDLGSSAVVIHEAALLAPTPAGGIDTVPSAYGSIVLQGALVQDDDLPARLLALQQFLSTQLASPAATWKLYCAVLASEDYLTQWQQFFQPLTIGERLLIRPSWETAPVPPHVVCLTLDPGLAFGTGSHPTTHNCLTFLVQYAPQYPGETLLDVGCGSGILSLAALRLGLHTAVGVDIDAQAIAVARQNAADNALQDQVRFLEGSWETVTGPFALIAANIYLGPLVEMLPALAKRLAHQGTLLLSGIVEHQETALQSAVHKAGLRVTDRLATAGWVTLAVQWASTPGG